MEEMLGDLRRFDDILTKGIPLPYEIMVGGGRSPPYIYTEGQQLDIINLEPISSLPMFREVNINSYYINWKQTNIFEFGGEK